MTVPIQMFIGVNRYWYLTLYELKLDILIHKGFKQMPFTNIQRKVIVPMDPLTIPENVITELSKESFNDLLKTNQGLLIIKLGAEWCGPCKKIDPTVYEWFSKLSLKQNVKCAIIDIDESFEHAQEFGIRGVPTLVMLDGNTEIKRKSGMMTKSELEARLND